MATVKLENGLLKFKVAPIEEGGNYGEIVECADCSTCCGNVDRMRFGLRGDHRIEGYEGRQVRDCRRIQRITGEC